MISTDTLMQAAEEEEAAMLVPDCLAKLTPDMTTEHLAEAAVKAAGRAAAMVKYAAAANDKLLGNLDSDISISSLLGESTYAAQVDSAFWEGIGGSLQELMEMLGNVRKICSEKSPI